MLINEVKKSIKAAGFKDGDKMPSVRKMAKQLNLSVTTVHKVYKELAAEGQIKLIQGKGCFWGDAPKPTVVVVEDVYAGIEKQFQKDLESGYLNAFEQLPSSGDLAIRYRVSAYLVKKFLNQKVEQGILVRNGRKVFFSEERSIGSSNYILFVHRSDAQGRMIIESERESDVFRTVARIAAEQNLVVHFLGYHEKSDQIFSPDGKAITIKNDSHCLGAFLSTWLVTDPQRFFAHFANFHSPISVWWEYAPDVVPMSVRNKKKWAFYNVAFGKEAGVIVGQYLKRKKIGPVHYISPYHESFWSKARLQGLQENVEVIPLVNNRFFSPFDLKDHTTKEGVNPQEFLTQMVEKLLEGATLDKFVCANDWVATTIIDCCKAKGKPVPYVVGFDDTVDSYRYVFDSFAFNVGTMVKEALYHILAPSIYAEQRRLMQAPLGRVVEKNS